MGVFYLGNLAESVSLEPKPPNILRINELYFSLNQSGRKL